MATYGATFKGTRGNEQDYLYGIIGKNSEAFTEQDLLTTGATGLEVAAAGEVIMGVAAKSQTMASDNQTVAKVEPAYIPVSQEDIYVMGANAALSKLASPGAYYNITGATGAQQIDVAGGVTTGASRVVQIVEVDPFDEGDLTKASIKIVRVFNFQDNQ